MGMQASLNKWIKQIMKYIKSPKCSDDLEDPFKIFERWIIYGSVKEQEYEEKGKNRFCKILGFAFSYCLKYYC